MDDTLLICFAVGLVALSVLLRELIMDYTQLNAQVDVTLQTMAAAVAQLQVHVTALAAGGNDAETVAAIISRLRAGTDQLAAAVAAVK